MPGSQHEHRYMGTPLPGVVLAAVGAALIALGRRLARVVDDNLADTGD